MTLDQIFAFAILAGMIALFIWDRIRYDLVAMLALLAAIVTGIVSPDQAFKAFGDDIIIIIGSVLVVSAAVTRSGVVERLIRPLAPYLRSPTAQVAVLASTVAVLSAFIKNIGALAMLLPVAIHIAKRNRVSVSVLLMPMSFAALVGGLATLIGTSPNIIVSQMRERIVGEPFRMFDFTLVGLGITAAGLLFLTVGWRLLPSGRRAAGQEMSFEIEDYVAELRLRPDSPLVDKTVAELEAAGEGEAAVAAIIREQFRRYVPDRDWKLLADDILILEGSSDGLKRMMDRARLELVATKKLPGEDGKSEDVALFEAVVMPDSQLVGRSPQELQLRERFSVNLLAISRRGREFARRLRLNRFEAGDVMLLQAAKDGTSDTLAALGCLPLAERHVQLGLERSAWLPLAIVGGAVALLALQLVTVAVAFFAAAVLMVVVRSLSLKEAYDAIEWPILVLFGALIPVSGALQSTGGTDIIAGWLSVATGGVPPLAALALIIVVAMAVTPFLNNAATVLVMAPIAASLADRLDLSLDAFLMAVAIGAACDFLTPIGHQCNTLVMGPGGYRFADYSRLGLPLSIIVVVVATLLIPVVWPLR